MKKLLIMMTLLAMSLMAADYSQMTMEELNALRGTIAVEDREAFRAEMQSRIAQMTPDELNAFREDRMATGGAGARDGSGIGSMKRGSANQGQGAGQRLQDGSGAGSMGQGAKGGRGQGGGK